MTIQPICLNCKHFTPNIEGKQGIFYCLAFPNEEQRTPEEIAQRQAQGITIDPKGIPDEILFGDNDHTTPIAGQVGDFVFEEGEPTEEQPQETMKKRHKVVNIKK